MAFRIWDITAGEYRDVTQVDIDVMMATCRAYGNVRQFIDQEHARLMDEIKLTRSKAGLPA